MPGEPEYRTDGKRQQMTGILLSSSNESLSFYASLPSALQNRVRNVDLRRIANALFDAGIGPHKSASPDRLLRAFAASTLLSRRQLSAPNSRGDPLSHTTHEKSPVCAALTLGPALSSHTLNNSNKTSDLLLQLNYPELLSLNKGRDFQPTHHSRFPTILAL